MLRWYYNVNFGIFDVEVTSSMDLSNLGGYTPIEDSEWLGLKQSQTDLQIIINNPETNHPMLYTDEELIRKKTAKRIRELRKDECFAIVDRGKMWYDHYVDTDAKKKDLKDWYEAWLVAPETLVIPKKPSWLDASLTDNFSE